LPKSPVSPTLHMLCGKVAAEKTTLTAELGWHDGTVAISEHDWLTALYADERVAVAIADHVRCRSKLRRMMGPHVALVLNRDAQRGLISLSERDIHVHCSIRHRPRSGHLQHRAWEAASGHELPWQL